MIDFNTSQLTWIVISSMTLGSAGYVKLDSNLREMDTKVAITQVRLDAMDQKLTELQKQLVRIEEKLDKKQGTK
jgi:hypothetical protein